MTDSEHRPSTAAEGRGEGNEGALRHAGRAFLLALYTGLRSLKLYPIENATAQKALDELLLASQSLLSVEDEIEVRVSGDFMFINATRLRLELENYASFSHILATFRTFNIGTLRFRAGIERRDWQIFIGTVLNLSARGEDSPDQLLELQDRMTAAKVNHIEIEPSIETQEQLDEMERAREVAKRTYSQGVAVTKEVVNSVRMGRTASLKKVKRAVQTIVDQVLNNETSLIGLTTIRDYDEYTFTHSVNVCIFSVALGKRVGFTRLQLYDLGLTALLHDIGKARIPLDI
ncbi:MAG: HD-GYP domain-containing protein, partial [Gemmatimonadales bacterium]